MGFDGTTKPSVRVFDLLTVTVLLEQCPPEAMKVKFWRSVWVHETSWRKGFWRPTTERTWCMPCLLASVASPKLDGRVALLDEVKRGTVQILDVDLRTPEFRCTKCRAHLVEVNPE